MPRPRTSTSLTPQPLFWPAFAVPNSARPPCHSRQAHDPHACGPLAPDQRHAWPRLRGGIHALAARCDDLRDGHVFDPHSRSIRSAWRSRPDPAAQYRSLPRHRHGERHARRLRTSRDRDLPEDPLRLQPATDSLRRRQASAPSFYTWRMQGNLDKCSRSVYASAMPFTGKDNNPLTQRKEMSNASSQRYA